MSILSDLDIKDALNKNEIIISPFYENQLSNCSYDVTLGENYYRPLYVKKSKPMLHNIYNAKSIEYWFGKPKKAKSINDLNNLFEFKKDSFWENISDGIDEINDKIILINPGETILAHTDEFIGGLHNITTMMKTKSSFGRNFIQVCKCAGWGDVGYINRWTMEITNCSLNCIIPLVVKRPIAQIVFLKTGNCSFTYHEKGNYQEINPICNDKDLMIQISELRSQWEPSNMLPKLYNLYPPKKKVSPKLDYKLTF